MADEHLERNLRALSPRYGHPLKTLAAWALQRMQREISVDVLLRSLGPRALPVLSARRLGVARRPDAVVVDVGGALQALERQGSSFARFLRALRMGLGDRFDDDKVRRGLALFPAPSLRAAGMDELLRIAHRLREIFQDEVELLDAFDVHQLADVSPDDLGAAGVDVSELERAITDPAPVRRLNHCPPKPAGGGHTPTDRVLNDTDDDGFDEITAVERVPFDAAAFRRLAARVRRPANALQRTLSQLGADVVVQRRRLSGRRVDRAILQSAVLRSEPRLLVARRVLPAADVFIAVVIDCSGSMDGGNMERVQLLGALLAEACRGMRGVDARFFGFSDEVLWNAGDARRCAVAELRADGSNNDAAALAHAARAAPVAACDCWS